MLVGPPCSDHPEVACDLTQRGGIALLLDRLLNEGQDFLLAFRDGIHMNTSLAERNGRCQAEIPEESIGAGGRNPLGATLNSSSGTSGRRSIHFLSFFIFRRFSTQNVDLPSCLDRSFRLFEQRRNNRPLLFSKKRFGMCFAYTERQETMKFFSRSRGAPHR